MMNSPMLRMPDNVFFSPSPSTRRRGPVILSNNKSVTPQSVLGKNDDAAERRQRLLSKVTSNTLQSSPATPRSASRLDSERFVSSILFFIF